MITRPMPYYLVCRQCGWKKFKRTLGCMPSLEQIRQLSNAESGCPKCGNKELSFMPAKGLSAQLQNWCHERFGG